MNDEPEAFAEPARRLPVGYYLDNLETLLRFVVERSGDLLTAEERRFVDEFLELGIDARRLWARLIVRRGPWFRVDRLRYSEIDLTRAIVELVERDFATLASDASQVPIEQRLVTLRTDELRRFALSCGCVVKPGVLRPQVLAATSAAVERAGAGQRLARSHPLIAPLRLAELEVCRVLFFGNFSQSLEQFVLRDIGWVRFEPYDLDASGRRFESRADFDSVRLMRELRGSVAEVCRGRELEKILGEGEKAVALASSLRPPAVRYLEDVFVAVGRELERCGRLDLALEYYARTSRPPARERRVRCLTALSRAPEAFALVKEMHAEPRDESERVFAARRIHGGVFRKRASRAFEEWTVEIDGSRDLPAPIEARALEALQAKGYQGAFAENWLWRSLFGLAFWEETWAPVPGAFAHPFQYGPLDLHDGFRERREPRFSERLRALEQEPSPGDRLLRLWHEKSGTASSLVFFLPELFPALQLACSSLSGKALAGVFDRLSRDISRYGTGFPDLFLIDPAGAPIVAEVKGPHDVLRPEQIGWLRHFRDIGQRAVVILARPPAA